jgi:hypothetical protein
MDTYASDVAELVAALDFRTRSTSATSTGGGEVTHYVAAPSRDGSPRRC